MGYAQIAEHLGFHGDKDFQDIIPVLACQAHQLIDELEHGLVDLMGLRKDFLTDSSERFQIETHKGCLIHFVKVGSLRNRIRLLEGEILALLVEVHSRRKYARMSCV